MRRFLFLMLVLICGCKAVDPHTLNPELAKKYRLDSIFVYKVIDNDTQLMQISKLNQQGRIFYQLNYYPDNAMMEFDFYNDQNLRTKSISYDTDSNITALALWNYNNEKLNRIRQFYLLDSIQDTLEPNFHFIYKYNSSKIYDSVLIYEITRNILNENFDTVLSEKHVFRKGKKRVMTIDYNISPALDSAGEIDTAFFKYDLYGRLKGIKYFDQIVKYTNKGNKRIKVEQYTTNNQLNSEALFRYNKIGLLEKEVSFSYKRDSISQEFNCGVQGQIDTTFYDYSVKPTIYIYKYTKRK